jgi:hypothetical protein
MQKKHVAIAAALIGLAFLIGYIPNELGARRLSRELLQTQQDLRLANLHRLLGLASHEASRNNYAAAGELAGRFFTGCRNAVAEFRFHDRPRTRIALTGYVQASDRILGDLANGEPATKEELASMFLTMNGVLERRQ